MTQTRQRVLRAATVLNTTTPHDVIRDLARVILHAGIAISEEAGEAGRHGLATCGACIEVREYGQLLGEALAGYRRDWPTS